MYDNVYALCMYVLMYVWINGRMFVGRKFCISIIENLIGKL